MTPTELEIRREELIQVTENIVEAFLCDLTNEGFYSPRGLRSGAGDIRVEPEIKRCLNYLADKIERLVYENMDCTCAPDSTEVCITCKLLS